MGVVGVGVESVDARMLHPWWKLGNMETIIPTSQHSKSKLTMTNPLIYLSEHKSIVLPLTQLFTLALVLFMNFGGQLLTGSTVGQDVEMRQFALLPAGFAFSIW